MMYKYRSTCRFSMLLQIGQEIVQIRPNQIIESDTKIENSYLKLIQDKPKGRKRNGSSMQTSDNGLREQLLEDGKPESTGSQTSVHGGTGSRKPKQK